MYVHSDVITTTEHRYCLEYWEAFGGSVGSGRSRHLNWVLFSLSVVSSVISARQPPEVHHCDLHPKLEPLYLYFFGELCLFGPLLIFVLSCGPSRQCLVSVVLCSQGHHPTPCRDTGAGITSCFCTEMKKVCFNTDQIQDFTKGGGGGGGGGVQENNS